MRIKDENKRIAIMEASIDLINEIGLSEASMSKIAKKASVSPSTIYVYFENKEELLNNLYLTVKEKMGRKFLVGINKKLGTKKAFVKFCNNIFNYIKNNMKEYLFSEQFCNSPLIKKINQEEVESHFKVMFGILEEGKEQGVLKNYPTKLLGTCGIMPILFFAKSSVNQGEIDKESLAQAIEIAWDGITTH